ncbi:hypothetical protein MBLNU230_g7437t1 [Neophaeotheca triangularis]
MPTTRRSASSRNQRLNEPTIDVPSDGIPEAEIQHHAQPLDAGEGNEEDLDEDVDDEDDVEDEGVEDQSPFPPPGLKEISSLASWTVSTAKPGNGVMALRSPDLAHFWQSDGPQPHLLSIHFFKLVSIVHMRVFLDFERDESYTPTKIQFLAGMGVHDLQGFAEMSLEQPQGWIDVDFGNVGPIEDDGQAQENAEDVDWSKRPVLRAFLIQVKILENHQNGKDTHLRAVQLFSRDDVNQRRNMTASARSPLKSTIPLRAKGVSKKHEHNNISMASWMNDPDLR